MKCFKCRTVIPEKDESTHVVITRGTHKSESDLCGVCAGGLGLFLLNVK